MEEGLVYIDGAYLTLIKKHLFKNSHPKIYIKDFALSLTRRENLNCEGIYYYNCPPYLSPKPTEDEMQRKLNHDNFVSMLKRNKIIVREGRCQKLVGGFRQKGVDVLLSIDMIINAKKLDIRNYILVACDSDFVPAIEEIRNVDKVHVSLYCISEGDRRSKFHISNHLLNSCDKTTLIKKADLERLVR